MFLILHEQQLTLTFPNVEIMPRIDLSIMVSNCSGERTFSKMGIIDSVLRSTMAQQRRNMLSLNKMFYVQSTLMTSLILLA